MTDWPDHRTLEPSWGQLESGWGMRRAMLSAGGLFALWHQSGLEWHRGGTGAVAVAGAKEVESGRS
jgi:hypothetical protein